MSDQGNPRLAGLWFGVSLYLNSALLLFATPIFTRLMTPEQYGEVALYNSLTTILGTFVTLSLYAGLFDRAILDFKDRVYDHVASMMGLIITAAFIISCLLWVTIAILGNYTHVRPVLLAFMMAYFISNSAFSFWRSIERFNYRYKLVSAVSISASLVGVLGCILILSMNPHGPDQVEYRVLVASAPVMVAGGFLLWSIRRQSDASWFDLSSWRIALALSLPLIPHYLSQALLQQFDRFAISSFSGRAAVGYYGLACAVASGHTLFWTAINSTWTPWLYRQIETNTVDQAQGQAIRALTVVAATAVFGALLAPEVIHMVAHTSYASAASFLPWLLLASFFQYCQQNYLALQFYYRRSKSVALVSVVAGGLSVALNFWAVSRFGPLAAALTSVFCHLLQLLLHRASSKARGMGPVDLVPIRVLLIISTVTALCVTAAVVLELSLLVRAISAAAVCLYIVREGLRLLRERK